MKICVEEYGFTQWEPKIRNMDNHLHKQNGGNFWVAIKDENIIGTISLNNLGSRKGAVKSLYVAQEFRNMKIASNLMNMLLDFARDNGYIKVELNTYERFKNAMNFYEKIGFRKIEQIGEMHIYEKEI